MPACLCAWIASRLFTRFFALAFASLSPGHLSEKYHGNAEYHFTERMIPIIQKHRHEHIPGAYLKRVNTSHSVLFPYFKR